jgi:Flp pilus assembly protein TadG
MRKANRRNNKGTSIIEVLVGAMFLIPIALFSVDLAAIVLSNSVNDHLAKDAARAAANQQSQAFAQQAAQKTVSGVAKSGIIYDIQLTDVSFNQDQVSVKTAIDVRLPVQFPGFATTHFVAQAVEPVVGTPADL